MSNLRDGRRAPAPDRLTPLAARHSFADMLTARGARAAVRAHQASQRGQRGQRVRNIAQCRVALQPDALGAAAVVRDLSAEIVYQLYVG